MLVAWDDGERFAIGFVDLRFECPCASCVDEHTGKRVLKIENIPFDVKPTHVQLVGKYAVQIFWSDNHSTGMYHFDRLNDLCRKHGRTLSS